MKNKKKKIFISSILLCVFSIGFIISYAFFSFNGNTNGLVISGGYIDMKLEGPTNEISLTNTFPTSRKVAKTQTNNFIDFTIEVNNTSKKDIYYEINLDYGDDQDSKTRILDKYLKFDLINTSTNENIFLNESFDSIDHKTIYTGKFSPSITESYNYTYKINDNYEVSACKQALYDGLDYLYINGDSTEEKEYYYTKYCDGTGTTGYEYGLSEETLNKFGYLQTTLDLGWSISSDDSELEFINSDGVLLTDVDSVAACVSYFQTEVGENDKWETYCNGTSDGGLFSFYYIADYFNGKTIFIKPEDGEAETLKDIGYLQGTYPNYTVDVSKADLCINYLYENSSDFNLLYYGYIWHGTDLYNLCNNKKMPGAMVDHYQSFELDYKYWPDGFIEDDINLLIDDNVLVVDQTIKTVAPVELSTSYRLRVWVSDEVTIGDETCTFTQEEWDNMFASIKVNVYSDLETKADISYSLPIYDVIASQAYLDNITSKYLTKTLDLNDYAGSTTGNGYGIYEMSSTKDDAFPIYYARGKTYYATFGGFCWQIVRTTDTGGVKLLYYGEQNENGTCTGISYPSAITSNYGDDSSLLSNVGYYYGKSYEVEKKENKSSNDFGTYYYSSNIGYIDGKYTLINPVTLTDVYSTSYGEINTNNTKYTCLSSTDSTCEKVYYITNTYSTYFYAMVLEGGVTFEKAIKEMTIYSSNEHPSEAAIKVDEWFENNLLSYLDKIEDTIYCNYRDYNLTTNEFNYTNTLGNYSCPKNDSFTVNESDTGNGVLKYPVGLLQWNELRYLAAFTGYGASWTMTPYSYNYLYGTAKMLYLNRNAETVSQTCDVSTYEIRPVISVKYGIKAISGSGTESSPYVLE